MQGIHSRSHAGAENVDTRCPSPTGIFAAECLICGFLYMACRVAECLICRFRHAASHVAEAFVWLISRARKLQEEVMRLSARGHAGVVDELQRKLIEEAEVGA